jgi:hypothetical protein
MSRRRSNVSAAIIPSTWLNAISAIGCVGAINRNSAFGLSLISSEVSISAAPLVVFEFFFGINRNSSRAIRSPSTIEP